MSKIAALALVLVAGCFEASERLPPESEQYLAAQLGAECGCPGGGDTCELAACGDRAYCGSRRCTIECDTAADCPMFAFCTEGSNGVRGCYYGCQVDEQCPTTTPTCVGSGFGHCEE